MKPFLLSITILSLLAATSLAQETHTFSNAEGETLVDSIQKYDYEEALVTLEKKGRVPLDTFSEADQAYIRLWNQIEGFKSTMRFKLDVQKSTWAKMKHEQTITPYFMDIIQIPGKKTPNHHIIIAEDYEEYNAVYLEAEGYSITLRNQNFFPIENVVVESKIYYEQELYVTPDSLYLSTGNNYYSTVTTNQVRFLSETIPIIIPLEEVVINSKCAIIVDHQVERNALTTDDTGDNGDDGGDGGGGGSKEK